MDKIMSDEERIRRAQEVVQRRQNKELDLNYNKIKIDKSKSRMRALLIQVLICLLIYCGFYYIKNLPENNAMNNKWIEKTKEVLSYDVDFIGLYNQIINKDTSDNNEEDKKEENINVIDDKSKISILYENEILKTEENLGIGGELDEEKNDEEGIENNNQEMIANQDIQYIKENINLTKPIQGVITSRFGERESNEIVSANHNGIDIGAVTGTDIISACDGKVIKVSSSGDFGKHIKIKNKEVTFIYAHCSKLLVNEGEEVKIGQKIAEVGSTGRATGPHLHFEIRREERAIDPGLIMNFE